MLAGARTVAALSLHQVADGAGCSTAYVHKLEQDRVRTPSPRVLAGLAQTLGLDYGSVMQAAGYDPPASPGPAGLPKAPRFSNAHIVELLESVRAELAEVRKDLAQLTAAS